ncbi:sodium channel protein Nach-like [Anopheles aquasalis]|uniref:sodium channel protein Nach-like n=1 Tax=Anopheles aquasalis TaxID=42839 RepID=UPI00215B1EE5|nr:sodium channel protein Nach-like [Anopheles aquasalis]
MKSQPSTKHRERSAGRTKHRSKRGPKMAASTGTGTGTGTESTLLTFRLVRRSFVLQTKEFFDNSTLHGVRYIAEDGRPFFERFMWFCFVAFGFIAAVVIIFSLWEKFQTNPTITGLDTDFHNQQVIFPTVLLCPTAPFDDEAVHRVAYQVLGGYEDGSDAYEPFLRLLTQLSYDSLREVAATLSDLPAASGTLRTANLRDLVFQVAVRCNDTFAVCRYKDENIDCCDMFKPIYTEHGFCFGFNARYTNSWNVETLNTEVHVLFETDKKWGLTFEPLRESHIFVHSYNEISGWDFQPQVLWDVDSKVEFLISMKQTYTTDDAQQLSIGQRKCIFPEEEKLQFYQDAYTFSGCMKECRIAKSLQFCKCVPPFYAPIRSIPICRVANLPCLSEYTDNITNIHSCQSCELGCLNTVYDIEKYSKIIRTEEEQQEAQVTIEYLTWPIIRYKREVLFGWVDLLVSFGGIAGLFLGFSLLSGVEIMYFFTMRTFCMVHKNRDELVAIERQKSNRAVRQIELGLRPVQRRQRQPHQGQQPRTGATDRADPYERVQEQQIKLIKLISHDAKLLLGNRLDQFDAQRYAMKRMPPPRKHSVTVATDTHHYNRPGGEQLAARGAGHDSYVYHGFLP